MKRLPLSIPALSVLSVSAGSGKTLVAGAIADWFRRQGHRVGVFVPIQTGAQRRREGLVSEESEFLAACADSRHPLDLICPQRFHEDAIPSVAARRAGRPLEWDAIDNAAELISRDSDAMIIQCPAPAKTPIDEKRTINDLLLKFPAPVVLVSRAGFNQISPITLAAESLRNNRIRLSGIVINRYAADNPTADEESSLREFEKWTKLPVLCVIPQETLTGTALGPGISAAVDQVDWAALRAR